MKTYIYEATKQDLQIIISQDDIENINAANSILIQVFSGEEKSKIEKILSFLTATFPNAYIITSTTDGEIIEYEVHTHTSVVTISTFAETSLKIAYADGENSFQTGELLAKELIEEDTKLLIVFADGLNTNGDEFLNGMSKINSKVIIAGGLAGDNAEFKKCFVGINNRLYSKGAVAVALNSKTLNVNSLYNFGWNPVGLEHTITKSETNRVYSIDNISTVDFYAKYLGEDIAMDLPKIGAEFPLIIQESGFLKARAALQKHEDGSLSFAGNIEEGEKVYLGIGEIEQILSYDIAPAKECTCHVETFYIYSCMARRRFIPTLIHKEIEAFSALAPTSGFFTYGEFFTDKTSKLLNQTLTAVALSENNQDPIMTQKVIKTQIPESKKTYKALLNFIKSTSKELNERSIKLDKLDKNIRAKNITLENIQEVSNLAFWELDLETMLITWSQSSYKLYNIVPSSKEITYAFFIAMVIPEDRSKLRHALKNLTLDKVISQEIKVKRNDGKILTLLESAKLVYDNGNSPVRVIGTTMDMTALKEQDIIMMKQAKHAQLGEMVSMIAHQWRQPLNSISAASIKLRMQSEMEVVTSQDIIKSTQFIEKMSQKMSQIINDFMNFSKIENSTELIDFNTVFDDIFTIMGVQLKNHNINIILEINKNTHLITYKKELEHIFINLISNARDALEDIQRVDKTIKIEVSTDDSVTTIDISDNAGGIEEIYMDKIFTPYFTTKAPNKGTGLGLYMSKKILQEHLGGTIFVKNRDEGALFTIVMENKND